MKKKIFSMLVLLMTAVTGAWADNYYLVDTYTITATVGSTSANLSETATLPYESTLAGCYEAATGSAPMAALTVNSVSVSSGDNVTLGEFNDWNTTLSVTGVGSATIAVTLNMGSANVTINFHKEKPLWKYDNGTSQDDIVDVTKVIPVSLEGEEWEAEFEIEIEHKFHTTVDDYLGAAHESLVADAVHVAYHEVGLEALLQNGVRAAVHTYQNGLLVLDVGAHRRQVLLVTLAPNHDEGRFVPEDFAHVRQVRRIQED